MVVFICDNRSASGKGYVSARTAYKKMGPSEMKDVEDGVAWLKQQPWVDPQRIGIGGWSYGGFMAAYALTHRKSFAMGIAGAPVTDWRNYDSVYTDRIMMTPEHNPEGYRDTLDRWPRRRTSRASCCCCTAPSTTTSTRRTRSSSRTSCRRRASRSG